jgi:hypothetical protein
VIMDNGEHFFTNSESCSDCPDAESCKESCNPEFTSNVRHGGSLEVPVSDSCLLDRECRRDMLTITSIAIRNGIGGSTQWRRQSRKDTANRANSLRNIQKNKSSTKTLLGGAQWHGSFENIEISYP